MSIAEKYYNGFYSKLSEIDEKGNKFNKIEAFLPDLKNINKVLDIGCGHGGISSKLIEKGIEVTGVEINDKAIESLKRKGFEVIKADISQSFSLKKEYDLVLILDVLEHLFDPVNLLLKAKACLRKGGYIIISVPLYFDLLDRLKIFFTGSVVSMDNLVYGEDLASQFRSYNYDHIRFFRPREVIEIGNLLDLETDKVKYFPTIYYGKNFWVKYFFRLISNRFTADINPNLFAHSMKVRWRIN